MAARAQSATTCAARWRAQLHSRRAGRRVAMAASALLGATLLVVAPGARVEAQHEMRVWHGRLGALSGTGIASFRMIGVSWPAGTRDAGGRVRVGHAGRWGPWQELDTTSEDGPDTQSREYGRRLASRPIWVGTADAYELRITPRS